VNPAAEIDAAIREAEDLLALENDRLSRAQLLGLTAPEIAQHKLRVALAEALLGKLRVQKDLLGVATAPNPALKRAQATETLAALDLKVAQAATQAAQAALDATRRLVGIGKTERDLLEAMLKVSDAALAEATAIRKHEEAKQARLAEELKARSP
jgi:hypothetical protein